MPAATNNITIEKVQGFIEELRKLYTKEKGVSVTAVCAILQLPNEYAKFVVDDGILIKTTPNARGRCKYIWNPTNVISSEYIKELCHRYSVIRSGQTRKRERSSQDKLDEVLNTVREMYLLMKEMKNELLKRENIFS